MVLFLSADDIKGIAQRVIEPGVAIRDAGLLEAAAARPQATVGGAPAYGDLPTMAAALTHSLVCGHALVDGNKRLGLACLIVFLGMNGSRLSMTNDAAYELIHAIASGTLRDIAEIAAAITDGTA